MIGMFVLFKNVKTGLSLMILFLLNQLCFGVARSIYIWPELGYMKTALSRTIHKYRRIITHQGILDGMTPADLTANKAKVREMLADIYAFYMEWDQLLHYFNQYVEFLDFSRKFGKRIQTVIHQKKNITDSTTTATVGGNMTWHSSTCRKSKIRKDVCYGPKSATLTTTPYGKV